uniref:paired immunoglobulin-like type 2 receptor beta n=1 Tax=Panthera onca TaxID=9690 RepID=UPI002954B2AF|nr:paired immunoglobulin-like type 2 receptor beta [Panthera onca]
MGPSLLLSLLLLPASLQAGSSKECNPNTDFGIDQPASLSAPERGSTCISFSYFYCWELAKDPRLSIAVRRTDFHGEVIYNSTQRFVHKDFKNRISLDLREGQNSGTLCIRNLRKEDENRYFCRVQVETLRDNKQVWQSIPGTKLTITDGESSCPAATTPTLQGALIPQAWPRPGPGPNLPAYPFSQTPLPTPLPSPGLCQLYSFSWISPNLGCLGFLAHPPHCPLRSQSPPRSPSLSIFQAAQESSLLASSWASSLASLPSPHAVQVDLTSSGRGLPSLCPVSL